MEWLFHRSMRGWMGAQYCFGANTLRHHTGLLTRDVALYHGRNAFPDNIEFLQEIGRACALPEDFQLSARGSHL